jgi:hypothetical protein
MFDMSGDGDDSTNSSRSVSLAVVLAVLALSCKVFIAAFCPSPF